MHEALSRLDGVTSISQTPDPVAWTCEMTTREGRLPSLTGIARAVHAVGNPFSVRGIEAVVVGTIETTPAGPILRASRTGESFALAPVTRKVQWDSRIKEDQPILPEERAAYERLVKDAGARATTVRVVGRVAEGAPGGAPILEVRTFERRP